MQAAAFEQHVEVQKWLFPFKYLERCENAAGAFLSGVF
ncbi:hypothetical protein GCHA_3802 [Paraglaciecola chathamensis S18K6]|uniref:Uncharacterized protein n=1 Tax=Paraglaciecola chathamensis S18K6 TaxID=1127672 RepID=A0AAV3V4T3_9ALTE|nr:hypothetical protein GCHA_3802 [Paraglaciecola chathamensis S18K6]|tara:strand:+ start:2320 stop:2433 length:114 start_codon:yes stop_codon:yes gene_type:complete